MPPMEQNEFKFPDEDRNKPVEAEFEIEIEDDTPPADRGKTPLPKPLVEELEKDELDSYDDAVKTSMTTTSRPNSSKCARFGTTSAARKKPHSESNKKLYLLHSV